MAFQFYCPNGHLLEGHESQMGQQSQCPMCGAIFVVPVVQTGPAAPAGWPPGYAPQGGYGQPQVYGQPQGAYGQPGYAQGGYAPPPGYGQPPAGAGYPGVPGPAYPGMAPGGMQPGWAPGPGQQAPENAGFPGVTTGGFPNMSPGPAAPEMAPGPPAEAAPQIQVGAPAPPAEAAPAAPAEPAKPAEPEKKEPRIVRIPCPQGHELQTPMDMVNQDVLCPICNTQFHLRYQDSIEFKEEQAELRRLKDAQLNQAALKWAIIAAVVVVVGILGMFIYLALRAPAEPSYPAEENAPPAASEPADGQPAAAPVKEPAGKAPAKGDSPEENSGDSDPESDSAPSEPDK